MKTKQKKHKHKDREATEERLIIAAEHVFSKLGFKGATTRMIAKKADINLALINRYFDGKYGLLLKVIERKIHIQFSSLPYPPQETVTAECQAYAMFKLHNFIADRHFFRIVLVQFLTDPKFLKRFQETLAITSSTEFESRLEILLKNKKLSPEVPIKVIAEVIETQIFGLMIGKSMIHGQAEAEVSESIKKFIISYCQSLEPR